LDAAIRAACSKKDGAVFGPKERKGVKIPFAQYLWTHLGANEENVSELPDLSRASAIQIPKVLSGHTELIWRAKALIAPNECRARTAVVGCTRSGDDVDSTIFWSRSAGK